MVALHGVDARADDGVEGLGQPALGLGDAELAEHPQLAHAGAEAREQVAQQRVVGGGGAADGVDLGGALDGADVADVLGDAHHLGLREGLLQGEELVDGEGVLVADGAPGPAHRGVLGELLLGGLELADLHAVEDAVGDLEVAEVGVEDGRALALHQQEAVAGLQPGEVEPVHGRVEESRVNARRGQGGLQPSNAGEMFSIHGRNLKSK